MEGKFNLSSSGEGETEFILTDIWKSWNVTPKVNDFAILTQIPHDMLQMNLECRLESWEMIVRDPNCYLKIVKFWGFVFIQNFETSCMTHARLQVPK